MFALSATNCWANCTAPMISSYPVLCTAWRRTFAHRSRYSAIGAAHLHSMGLAIAASCDEDSLVWAGGSVGAFVFACSRQASPREVQSPRTDRRKITLATGVLRVFAGDDEMVQEAPTAPLPSVEYGFDRSVDWSAGANFGEMSGNATAAKCGQFSVRVLLTVLVAGATAPGETRQALLRLGIGFRRLRPPRLLRAHDRELGLHSFLLFLGQDRAFPGWRHVMDRRKGRSDLRTLRRVLRHATCRDRQLRHT